MMKKSFIPNWYQDKKSKIINTKVKLCIKVVTIINIILISLILNISKDIKNTQGELSGENNTNGVIETVKKSTIIIEKYKELSDFFEKNNFIYKNVIITKDNLEIDIEVNNYEEYIQVIKLIEVHYSIKKLTPNIKNERNYSFKVIL